MLKIWTCRAISLLDISITLLTSGMLYASSHYPKSFSFNCVLLSANEFPSIISSLQLDHVCRFTAVINQGTGGMDSCLRRPCSAVPAYSVSQ